MTRIRPRSGVTDAQLMAFIRGFVTDHGYPPSVRDIGEATGLASTSSVRHRLRGLEEAGLIRRDPRYSRAIAITEGTTDA